MFCFLNNKFVQEKDAKISIFDRSFKYGENAFETILVKNNKIIELKKHLLRLKKSAKHFELQIPFELQKLEQIISELIQKNKLKDCLLRITLSHGEDKNNRLEIPKNSKNTIVITCTKFTGYKKEIYERGLTLKIVKRNKIDEKIISPKAKIGAVYIPNILAKKEALASGYDDALFLDRKNYVLETSIANIFWTKEKIIFTPDLECEIFPGITRESVLLIASKLGFKLKLGKFKPENLLSAEEVFLTYTSAGIMPVNKINQQSFKIGPISRTLRENLY